LAGFMVFLKSHWRVLISIHIDGHFTKFSQISNGADGLGQSGLRVCEAQSRDDRFIERK
jgi:hypothetical protein